MSRHSRMSALIGITSLGSDGIEDGGLDGALSDQGEVGSTNQSQEASEERR